MKVILTKEYVDKLTDYLCNEYDDFQRFLADGNKAEAHIYYYVQKVDEEIENNTVKKDEIVEALKNIVKQFPVSEFNNVKKHFSKLVALAEVNKLLHKLEV